MTSTKVCCDSDLSAQALESVGQALRAVFDCGVVTASVETALQNALHGLRSARADPTVLQWAETCSSFAAAISLAQRTGRPNLQASKMLRLRRFAASKEQLHA